MKLRVKRSTKNKKTTLFLETIEFSERENNMLNELGEPVINVDKTYGNNSIKFEKKIRNGFKVRLKFDANLENDADQTAAYIEEFLEFIQEELSDRMSLLSDDYNEEFIPKDQSFEITY